MSNITVGRFGGGGGGGGGSHEVGGDGEFSPSFLRNLATGRSVPKTVPEFNSFLYRPSLLTREVKMTKSGHCRCFLGACTRTRSV